MDDSNWKEEYKKWKVLKPSQLQLLDEGAQSLSQTWLLSAMWSDWREIKKVRDAELPSIYSSESTSLKDPWETA